MHPHEVPLQLPQELEELILQHLHNDLVSLKAYSLVCHRFADISRSYIFNTIALNFSSYGDPQTVPTRFMELLISSPYICDLVQNLSIIDNRYKIGGPTHLRFDTILPTCLPLLQHLRSISVESTSLTSLTWTAMSQGVQDALEETLRSPYIVSISFYRILDLPLALLSRSSSIRNLSLRLVSFSTDDMKKEKEDHEHEMGTIQGLLRPRLTSLLLMLSDSIFNFLSTWITGLRSPFDVSGVQRLSVSMTMEYYDHGNVRTLLNAMASSLEVFCFSPVFGLGGFYHLDPFSRILLLLISLCTGSSNTMAKNPIDLSSLCNLRVLRLRLGMIQVLFNRTPVDFLPWIMETVSQLNSMDLEEISLKVDLAHAMHQESAELDSWSVLDSLLTKAYPSLRKFTVYALQDENLECDLDDRARLALEKRMVSLVKRDILNIEVASSRIGFLASETSNIFPSNNIS